MTKKEFLAQLKSNRGDIGIKQIAVTVAIILVIGAAVTIIAGSGGTLSGWITQVWNMLIGYIQNNIK